MEGVGVHYRWWTPSGFKDAKESTRAFMHREGEYYQRWREISGHKTGIIFSVDGSTRYPRSSLYKHFKRIMAIAEIDPARKPHLVPYSFRHFAITQRVMSGLHFRKWRR